MELTRTPLATLPPLVKHLLAPLQVPILNIRRNLVILAVPRLVVLQIGLNSRLSLRSVGYSIWGLTPFTRELRRHHALSLLNPLLTLYFYVDHLYFLLTLDVPPLVPPLPLPALLPTLHLQRHLKPQLLILHLHSLLSQLL